MRKRLITVALLLALVASVLMLVGCATDQTVGDISDAVFCATGTVAEVSIDGGTKTVAVVIEEDDSNGLAIGEQALFDFSDFDVSYRLPREDLDGIYPGDEVKVEFFLNRSTSGGYSGYKITKLPEQDSTQQ